MRANNKNAPVQAQEGRHIHGYDQAPELQTGKFSGFLWRKRPTQIELVIICKEPTPGVAFPFLSAAYNRAGLLLH